MSRHGEKQPGRRIPRWLLWVLLALLAVAVAANAAWLMRRPRLLPIPEITTANMEPQVAEIIEAGRHLVKTNEHSAQAWGELGAVLRAHELGPEANDCFRNAQTLDPTDYRWPYLLGVSLMTTDADAGLACFRRAAALAGDLSHVQLRLAETLANRGLNDEAALIIERVLKANTIEPRAQLAKARLLFEQGKIEESRMWAEKSAAAAPDKRATQILLAQIYRRLGDKQGEQRAQAAAAELPEGHTPWDDPDVQSVNSLRRDRAWQLLTGERPAESGQIAAVTELLAELALADPAAGAAIEPVRTYLEQKDHAGAEAVLRQLLLRHDDSERLHYQLGVLCFQQQRYEPAAEEFRRAVALKPDHVDAYYNLGHALRMTGDEKAARDAFVAAVRLSPSHARARANLAEVLFSEGKTEEARQHLAVAAKLAPQDPKVRELMARFGSGKE
jgi:tetratricopeptide (TPR) repeat protein